MLNIWVRGTGLLILCGLLTAWIPLGAVQQTFCVSVSALATVWLVGRYRQRRAVVVPRAWLVLAAIPVWIAVQRLSIGAGVWMGGARELGMWSTAALAGLMLTNEIEGHGETWQALRGVSVAAGAIAVWALFQGLTSGGLVAWIWPTGAPIERVWGPFPYHNKLAQFAELVLPIPICLAAADWERRWRWVAVAAGLLAVTVVAASRAGVVLLGGELMLCGLLLAAKRRVAWRQAGMLAGQLILVSGAAIAVAGWEALRDRVDVRQMLADHRFDLNRSSLAIARAHLPWGAGYGQWPVVYPEFALFDDGRYANQAHNDWLQWLCEGGIPGVLLMVLFAALVAVPLLRSIWGCGVLVVLLHAAVDYPFHQSAPLAVLILCVALVAARDEGRWIARRPIQPRRAVQYAPSPVTTTLTVRPSM